MFKKFSMRCLVVAALSVAVLSSAAPLLADGGEAEVVGETSGIIEGILDWLLDLVEPAAGAPDQGDTGPRVDPAG